MDFFLEKVRENNEGFFISIVGAGGKSSLFSLIAGELIKNNEKTILTTTAHMFLWQLSSFLKKGILIDTDNEQVMENNIKQYFDNIRQEKIAILVCNRSVDINDIKCSGPKIKYLDKWWEKKLARYILVEADGAKGKPIKAPDTHEPPVPKNTTDIIGVIGIESIGLTLSEESVFRSHIFSSLTGLNYGEKVNLESVVKLINHPKGLFKNAPTGSKKYLFINKVNCKKRIDIAERLIAKVLKDDKLKINAIIIGDTFNKEKPFLRIIKGKI